MWELYRHCHSSGDVETVLSAAKQLQQSADTHVVPAPDVPKSLDRFVTKQPVRTTVDPKALAASCTLQAARTSLSAGREQEAEQLLYAVSDLGHIIETAWRWMTTHRTQAMAGR